jgi:hypothetical protein
MATDHVELPWREPQPAVVKGEMRVGVADRERGAVDGVEPDLQVEVEPARAFERDRLGAEQAALRACRRSGRGGSLRGDQAEIDEAQVGRMQPAPGSSAAPWKSAARTPSNRVSPRVASPSASNRRSPPASLPSTRRRCGSASLAPNASAKRATLGTSRLACTSTSSRFLRSSYTPSIVSASREASLSAASMCSTPIDPSVSDSSKRPASLPRSGRS